MMEILEHNGIRHAKLSDYMYVLYKWKKFLAINLLLVTIVATIISFLIPQQYRSVATVMIPPENSMGLGGLTGLLSNKSTASIGSKLFGVASTSEDMLLGILNSRMALVTTINKFGLLKYYEIEDGNMDKALRAFGNDIGFSPNEHSMIEISVLNKDPFKSAEIANYFAYLLDSLNIKINMEQAKNNRMFIEKRYQKNLADLKNAEDSLYKFQKKYGIFAVPEQLEVSVKAAGEIEAKLAEREMESYFTKQLYGESSPQYQGVKAQEEMLKRKISELKNSGKLSNESNVLFPFKNIPDMSIRYMRALREVEIQSKVLEVVLPMYEQSKVEEQKSIPTVVVLDKAVPAQLKDSPKKAFIILGAFFIALFVFIVIVYWADKAYSRKTFHNPLEEKASRISSRLVKYYGLRF